MNTKSFATLAALLCSTTAFADGVTLGEPAYGGTGCPSGSASVTLSPDASALSIMFDSFVAEAGNGRRIDRKSCGLAIPVHVPAGLSVALIKADYRGFNSIPRGGRSTFSNEVFFAGTSNPRDTRTFSGPQDEDYFISNESLVIGNTWSPCGQDVILRTQTSITAMSNSRGDQVLSTLDSADLSSGLIFHLSFRQCH